MSLLKLKYLELLMCCDSQIVLLLSVHWLNIESGPPNPIQCECRTRVWQILDKNLHFKERVLALWTYNIILMLSYQSWSFPRKIWGTNCCLTEGDRETKHIESSLQSLLNMVKLSTASDHSMFLLILDQFVSPCLLLFHWWRLDLLWLKSLRSNTFSRCMCVLSQNML